MKFHALFLATMLGAATLHAQNAAPTKKDNAVTAINDRGAKDAAPAPAPAPPATADDMMRIPAAGATPTAPGAIFYTALVQEVKL